MGGLVNASGVVGSVIEDHAELQKSGISVSSVAKQELPSFEPYTPSRMWRTPYWYLYWRSTKDNAFCLMGRFVADRPRCMQLT